MTCFWKPHFSVQNHRHFSHVLRWRMAIQMKKPSSTSSTWSLGNVVDKFGHPKIRWFRFAHVCSLFTFHKLRWYTNIPQLYWSKPFPESRLFAADWGAIWFSMSRVYPPENKHGSPPCPAIFISSVGIFQTFQTFQTRIFEQGLPIFHLFGSREFGPLGLTDLMAGWRIQMSSRFFIVGWRSGTMMKAWPLRHEILVHDFGHICCSGDSEKHQKKYSSWDVVENITHATIFHHILMFSP